MKQRNTILRARAIGAATLGLALLALWCTGHFPPVAYANGGGGVTYRTLTKCAPTGGAILNSPTGTTFVNNTVVALTADPDPGFVFTGWTGAASGTTNPVSLTMNANKSVCAMFKPTVSIWTANVINEGQIAYFSVRLSAPSVDTVTVAYNASGGSATADVDYENVSGTLTFPPGITEQIFTVQTILDNVNDDNEHLFYSLSNPVNAILTGNSTAWVVIGFPPVPWLSFDSASSITAESAGTVLIPLDIRNYLGGPFGVFYRYSGTATRGVDYNGFTNVALHNLPNAWEAAIEISIIDDELDEGDETIVVTLESAGSLLEEPAIHTLTIVDDDDEPLVASFEATPRAGTVPLEVEFTDTSASGLGAIVGWEWDFGDGAGSTAQHPIHTYDEPGAYTVSLTVETGDGEDTEVRAGYIQVGGAGASIGVSPSLIQFGHVPVGQRKIVSVTIRNDGDEILTGTASVEAPFGIDGDAAYAIPPEGETFLNVVYAPTAAVASYDVIGLPGGGNAQVALHGFAIAPEPEDATGVRLNELVVWNTSGVVSANGEYVDWIELYNENDHALDISGWTLTDDDEAPDKYTLPAGTTIGPKSYLLVYASTETASFPGELHTGFALDEVNGGYVGLFAPIQGTPTLMSEVEYPAAEEPDRSYALLDGEEEKATLGWNGPVPPSPFLFNQLKKIWDLWVYVSPGLQSDANPLIPDPTRTLNQHTGGVDDYITIYEWLPLLRTYTSLIFLNDQGATLESPLNTRTVTIDSDVGVAAGVDFHLDPFTNLVKVVSGMAGHLDSLEDLFRTANSVGDSTLVVCATIDLNIPGQAYQDGVTVLSTEKKLIIIPALSLDASIQRKWHLQSFTHELGHFAGIRGHVSPWNRTMIMAQDGVVFGTPPVFWREPWFLVAATPNVRSYFEGERWSSPSQRRQEPPRSNEMDGHAGEILRVFDEAMATVIPQTW